MVTGKYNWESLSDFVETACRRYRGEDEDATGLGGLREVTVSPGALSGEDAAERTLSVGIESAWRDAAQVSRKGEVVEGIVTGWNRGGLLVRWNDLQGFVPVSQLKEVPIFENDDSRDEQLARWVGEELQIKIIELDQDRNRLVFSERATLWGPKDAERLLADIDAGEVRDGYVSNLCSFGAFVDLGGIDGLIHISELSWGRVSHPREMLAIGQQVKVFVLSVDRANQRIGLSLKRLRPNPWSLVEGQYSIGDIVDATVTNVVDFGAFAQIQEGLEGLIHISELAAGRVSRPAQVVSPGDRVPVRILGIDCANHRLSLSIRQVAEQHFEHKTDVEPPEEPGDAHSTFLY